MWGVVAPLAAPCAESGASDCKPFSWQTSSNFTKPFTKVKNESASVSPRSCNTVSCTHGAGHSYFPPTHDQAGNATHQPTSAGCCQTAGKADRRGASGPFAHAPLARDKVSGGFLPCTTSGSDHTHPELGA